jgi:hypothetical protein
MTARPAATYEHAQFVVYARRNPIGFSTDLIP